MEDATCYYRRCRDNSKTTPKTWISKHTCLPQCLTQAVQDTKTTTRDSFFQRIPLSFSHLSTAETKATSPRRSGEPAGTVCLPPDSFLRFFIIMVISQISMTSFMCWSSTSRALTITTGKRSSPVTPVRVASCSERVSNAAPSRRQRYIL